ncbi:MAG: PTS sugar transporter subunit IIA [Gammaproteobacteria bacterium]|nr:PTS sugar transporter subunit IIA [Gammaproteobacteria bacterium]
MTTLKQLLSPSRIVHQAPASSSKKALETLSHLLSSATPNLSQAEIFNALLSRERLGSTGLGHGMALPHGRMTSLEHPVGAMILLKSGIDFDAPDRQPVDILFSLLVPDSCTEDHLHILAKLAEMFSDPNFRQTLRHSKDAPQLFQLLEQYSDKNT